MTNKLIVQQIKNKKIIKRWKLRPETSLWSVGSSPGAELKILDFSWNGIAGCIEYNGKSWKYIDFQNKENIKKETKIETKLTIQYGETELHILPVGQPRDLFDQLENNTPKNATHTKSMQQIVVRCNNKIIETHVWTSKKPFKFPYLKDRYVYPTESMNWDNYTIGPYFIQHRKI